jgi:hypothetical protein
MPTRVPRVRPPEVGEVWESTVHAGAVEVINVTDRRVLVEYLGSGRCSTLLLSTLAQTYRVRSS